MKVDTRKLHEQALQLRTIERELQSIQDNVHHIAARLSQEITGEKLRDPLRRIALTIGMRESEVQRLSRSLDQIADVYEDYEQRIVNEAEHANIRYITIDRNRIPVQPIPIIALPIDDIIFQPLDWTPWNG